ncbi:MAG: dTDP-4-dehydrorhamnose reductase [Candidatus Saganbacteria bacterium]|nr:dTDP-4-dehydrorhamnose reductase [Candidatus Saganbacteria bacterium]
MKIMIVGADGQLGSDLCRVVPSAEQIPLTVREIDVTDRERTAAAVAKYAPQAVINTAGYHRVDDCEDHAREAFAVNALGAKYLAEACRAAGAALMHISTDYVFAGEKQAPYTESDAPGPQTLYGISKLAGEFCVRYLLKEHFIVRTAGLYGRAGCLGKGGGNFVENMIRLAKSRPELKVVTDEIVSPTYTRDLARKLYELAGGAEYGLYHIVNHGRCSWYDFTVKIFELLNEKVTVKPALAAEFPAKAKRPRYSALANARLAAQGRDDLRDWPAALRAYLIESGHLREGKQ